MYQALLSSIFILAAIAQPVAAHVSNFELVLTGELVSKLEPKTTIRVGTIGTTTDYPFISFSTWIESFPLELPAKHFKGRMLRVSFYSPRSKEHLSQHLFSMELSHDLFDTPRRINIKLDAPTPRLRRFSLGPEMRYSPNITKRMRYVDLPYWDKKLGRLAPIPSPPIMRVSTGDGTLIRENEMRDWCMGAKWFGDIGPLTDLADGTEVQLEVNYDSGGLFEPIKTEFKFKYDRDLHGE